MTIRCFAIGGVNANAIIGAGAGSPPLRNYAAGPGQFVDVPGTDVNPPSGDAAAISTQGFGIIGTVGSGVAARPSTARPGAIHVDTGINQVLFFDGASWRSPFTGTAM